MACGSKRKASGMTDIIRQNENICVKKMKKLYSIIRLFAHWSVWFHLDQYYSGVAQFPSGSPS